MNQLFKYVFISIALNILSVVILSLPLFSTIVTSWDYFFLALILIGVSLVVQIIVGLVLLTNDKKRVIGQGMLLSIGILLLGGFLVCSSG